MSNAMVLTGAQIGVCEGPLYEEPADDCGWDGRGVNVRFDYYVEVIAADGKIYRLAHPYRFREYADKKATFVQARGVIDLDLWNEVEVMSLEERFALYAQAEDEVRRGHRSEEELYHGIP